MKRFKIIVRGGYGLTNFGDDALLKSIHEDYLNKWSDKELAYSSTQQNYLKKDIHNYQNLPLDVDYSKLTKVLIYGGGTQFYSFKKKRSLFKRIIFNFHYLLNPSGLKAKLKTIRTRNIQKNINSSALSFMAVGIGVGPFLPDADPLEEKKVASLFKKMKFVAVRDIYSLKKCQEWGIKNFGLYADLCFKMEHTCFFKPSTKKSIEKVGIIVRDWNNTKEGKIYIEKILSVAEKLKNQNKEIHFIVFAKSKDPKWIKLLHKRREKTLLWDPDSTTISSFFNILSEYDLFITARYHGAVFSAMLGKPFITIELEQKLSMFQNIFSESSCNWNSPFEENEILEYFKHIENNYQIYSEKMVDTAKEQRKAAIQMNSDLNFYLQKELEQ